MSDAAGIVPTSETLFAPFNLLLVLAMFIVVPTVNRLMLGKEEPRIDASLLDETSQEAPADVAARPAQRLDTSLLLAQAASVLGGVFSAHYFFVQNGSLDLNIVNFLFLFGR